MKTVLVLLLSLLALCIPVLTGSSQEKPVVLLIARGESTAMGEVALKFEIEKEVNTIINKLNSLGYAVEVASESGKLIQAGGSKLPVDKKLADVQVQNYVGVIIPCMGEVQNAIPKGSVKIVQDLYNRNVPVAAQHSGVIILGAAGLLRGRNYAIGEGWDRSCPYVKDGNFKGVGVVRDGNIVTSGTCPWLSGGTLKDGTDELVTTFVKMLGRSD